MLLPVIRYSVVWWNTLHQGQSIGLVRSTIDPAILWPLWFTLAGFTLFFASVVLMRMRTILARTRVEARLRRRAAEIGADGCSRSGARAVELARDAAGRARR